MVCQQLNQTKSILIWPSQHPRVEKKQNARGFRMSKHSTMVKRSKMEDRRSKRDNRLLLVRQLRLFLGKSVLLRCGRRIHNAPLSELTKFPYLLHAKHPFTDFVIQDAHLNQLHAGVNSTVTALRQKFWIPAASQPVKKVLRGCG